MPTLHYNLRAFLLRLKNYYFYLYFFPREKKIQLLNKFQYYQYSTHHYKYYFLLLTYQKLHRNILNNHVKNNFPSY